MQAGNTSISSEALENAVYVYLRERFCVDTRYRFRKGYIQSLPAVLAKHFKIRGVKTYNCKIAVENLLKKGLICVYFKAPDTTIEYVIIKQHTNKGEQQ